MKGNIENMSIVKGLFNLDYTDYRILGHIANNGKSTRHNVGVNVGIHYKPYLSEKQIGRRIERLNQNEFLQLVESRPIKNLKNKIEKIYGLTLKGFFASLLYCELEENYLFKKYLDYVNRADKWQYKNIDDVYFGKPNKIAPIIVKFIQTKLQYFFHYGNHVGITLDKIKNIIELFDMADKFNRIEKKESIELNKFMKACSKKFENFILNNDVNSKYHFDLFLWVCHWIHVIDFLATNTAHKKIISHLRNKFPSEFMVDMRKKMEERLEEDMKKSMLIDKVATDAYFGRKVSKSLHTRLK